VDWLGEQPEVAYRRVSGTVVFADISGFTALTERLAVNGKAGAEEMGDLLNAIFERLLTAAYDYGANLIKWGGDAVLLLFDGDGHAARACRASWQMQQVMREVGRVQTSRGVVRLGMSIGVHSGDIDFLLVGQRYRELVVTGPGASEVARMEKAATRGFVVVSPETAALLAPNCTVPWDTGRGRRLTRAPDVGERPNRAAKRTDVDLGALFSAPLREHLVAGGGEHEHRPITVGFIEFSGTDALLAEHGPQALTEGVAYVLDAVQQAADDNGVTVLATDVGEDGGKIILTAGVPVATGDDETNLLATVRRVVHPGGRLALRAGVTNGRVFAGDYGPFYRRTYSIAGDMVNLAARLMAKAERGQVLTTPEVVERSRTRYDITPLEPFAVKGKRLPVRAVAVGDPQHSAPAAPGTTLPIVGRDRELSLLLRQVESAAVGFGATVEVVAPAGMGKSRLVEEVVARSGVRTLWFDGDVYGRSTPYQPMHRALRHTLALPATVSDEVLDATLTDLVAGTAPDLQPWLPLLRIVAGIPVPPTPEIDVLDPQVRRARLEAVTSDMLGRLLNQPLIMVVNDVQFMDDASCSLLSRLVADVAGRPWLILLTRRAGAPQSVEVGENATTIELGPLGADAAERLLLAALADTALPPHRMRQLVERAGGHPLFVTMLAAAAQDGADIDQLPHTVEALIAAQIDRLPLRSRRWLRTAAVLGMAFEPQWLTDVLVGTELSATRWSELGDFIALHPDQRLHFAHHLIRLTAYEGLPFRRRVELHARAAQTLEDSLGGRADGAAALLSLHCLFGRQYPAAWRYSRIAAERARDQYALSEAVDCYQRAIDAASYLPSLPRIELAETWEAMVDLTLSLGDADASERALRQARRIAADDDAVRYARLCRRSAQHHQNSGRHASAVRWALRGRTALANATEARALAERAALAATLARIRQDQGTYRTATVWAERAVVEAGESGDIGVLAQARGSLSVLRALSGLPWDDAEIAETLAMFDATGNLRDRAWMANSIGMCSYFGGRWDDARAYYEQAELDSRRTGREYAASVAAANRAEILVQQRRADEAQQVLEPALRVFVAARATSFVSFAVALAARAQLMQGVGETALTRLGEARQLALEMGETDEALSIQAVAAEALVRIGDPHAALGLVDEALRQPGGGTAQATAMPALLRARGAALAALGRAEAADEALRQALDEAQRKHILYEVHECLCALIEHDTGVGALQLEAWRATQLELAGRLGIVLG
jgi:class 3 adenylate cyclase/tetratricopeptide (TPR) repeat protein